MRFNACQFSQLNWWMEDKRDYGRHSLFLHMAPCLCQRQICSYIRPLVFVRSRSVLTYGPWSLSEADLFIHMAPCLCQRQICSYIRPLVFVRGRSVPWIQQGVSRLGWHHCMWWPCSPFFVAGAAEMSVSLLVSWCFEPRQPLGVTWGLNTNSNLYLSYSAHKSFHTKTIFLRHNYFTHTHTHTHTHTWSLQYISTEPQYFFITVKIFLHAKFPSTHLNQRQTCAMNPAGCVLAGVTLLHVMTMFSFLCGRTCRNVRAKWASTRNETGQAPTLSSWML